MSSQRQNRRGDTRASAIVGLPNTGSSERSRRITTTITSSTAVGGDLSGTVGNATVIADAVTDPKIGSRTADPATAFGALTGTLTQIISLLYKMVVAITGKANAWTAPAITLEASKTRHDTTDANLATHAGVIAGSGVLGHVRSGATGADVSVNGSGDMSLVNSGVTAATYTNMTGTVDAKGRLTSAASGTVGVGGSGTVNKVPIWATSSTLGDSRIVTAAASAMIDMPGLNADNFPMLSVGKSTTGYGQTAIVALAYSNPAIQAYNTNATNAAITAQNLSSGPAFEAINGSYKGVTALLNNGTASTVGIDLAMVTTTNAAAGLKVAHDGTGRGVQVTLSRSTNSATAIYGTTAGTGKALEVSNTNAANTANVVNVTGNGTGVGTLLQATGTGRAVDVQISNAASTSDALRVYTNGSGDSVSSIPTGTGHAVYAQISNAASTNDTIHGETNGTGNALKLNITNAGTSTTATRNIIIGQSAGANVWRVDKLGKTFQNGGSQNNGADIAEGVDYSGTAPTAGDVLICDTTADRTVTRSSAPNQRVMGIYSTRPGVTNVPSDYADDLTHIVGGVTRQAIPMGVVGFIPVKVNVEGGSIAPGDRLVTSSTAGEAMKAGTSPANGTVVGIAMSAHTSGVGVIECYRNGDSGESGGSAPANMATTDTGQNITGNKDFYGNIIARGYLTTVNGIYMAGTASLENGNTGQIFKLGVDAIGNNTIGVTWLSGFTGGFGIGTLSATAPLDVTGDTFRRRTTRTPASYNASGNEGDQCDDNDYVYYYRNGRWDRVAKDHTNF